MQKRRCIGSDNLLSLTAHSAEACMASIIFINVGAHALSAGAGEKGRGEPSSYDKYIAVYRTVRLSVGSGWLEGEHENNRGRPPPVLKVNNTRTNCTTSDRICRQKVAAMGSPQHSTDICHSSHPLCRQTIAVAPATLAVAWPLASRRGANGTSKPVTKLPLLA